jgi:hypothetical protein
MPNPLKWQVTGARGQGADRSNDKVVKMGIWGICVVTDMLLRCLEQASAHLIVDPFFQSPIDLPSIVAEPNSAESATVASAILAFEARRAFLSKSGISNS